MIHLTELVVYFCHSSNERIAGVAEELLPFVINCTDLGTVPIQFFTFLRKSPPSIYNNEDKDRFAGDTNEDQKENVLNVAKTMYSQIFKLKPEDETFQQLQTKFFSAKKKKSSKKTKSPDVSKDKKDKKKKSTLPVKGDTINKIFAPETSSKALSRSESQSSLPSGEEGGKLSRESSSSTLSSGGSPQNTISKVASASLPDIKSPKLLPPKPDHHPSTLPKLPVTPKPVDSPTSPEPTVEKAPEKEKPAVPAKPVNRPVVPPKPLPVPKGKPEDH